MSKDEEIIRISTKALPAPGTIVSGTLGDEVQTVRKSIAASGSVVQSGEVPDLDWRQKVNPSSGPGVDISGAGTADGWGSFVNIVTPSQDFEVVKIEALLKEKDQYHLEYGKSGQNDTDISHLSTQESGSVIVDTLNPPKRYNSGDDVSIRTKSEQGSGIRATVWVFTREPS